MGKTNQTTKAAATRIQRSEAVKNGGKVSKGSHASRATRAADKNSKK